MTTNRFFRILLIGIIGILSHTSSTAQETVPLFSWNTLQPISADNADQLEVVATLSNGTPNALQWSPDGDHLAISTEVGMWIYDLTDETSDGYRIEGHVGVPDVVFSPAGGIIVTYDCTYWQCPEQVVWVRDALTGEPLIQVYGNRIASPVFSSDGQWLAVGDSNRRIRIWETDRLQAGSSELADDVVSCTLDATWSAETMLFIPHSTLLASTHSSGSAIENDNAVHIWDVQTCEQVLLLDGQRIHQVPVQFSDDGRYLITVDRLSEPVNHYLWDIESEQVIAVFPAANVQFSPDSMTLLIFGETTQVWDISSQSSHELTNVTTAIYLPDGRLVAGMNSGQIQIIDAGEIQITLETHDSAIVWLNASSDGRWLLSYDTDLNMLLWDLQQMGVVHQWQMNVTLVSFSPDDERLVWRDVDTGHVFVWNMDGETLRQFDTFHNVGNQLYMNSSGNRLITYGHGLVNVWAMTETGLQRLWSRVLGRIAAVTDTTILTISERLLEFWDVETGERVQTIHNLYSCNDAVWRAADLALSSESHYLACNIGNTRVVVWDVVTGEELFSILEFGLAIAIDDVRRLIAVGGRTTTVVWDITQRQQIASYPVSTWFDGRLMFHENGDVWLIDRDVVFNLTQDTVIAQMEPLQAGITTYTGCEYDVEGCEAGGTYEVPYYYEPFMTLASPDMRILFSANTAQELHSPLAIRLWDIETDTSITFYERFATDFGGVTFSPDSRLLVIRYDDYWVQGVLELRRLVDIIDVASGEQIVSLSTYTQPAGAALISPDNRLLIISSDTIRLWGISAE